ncbi:SLC35B2 family protein [Megaselia abdita]
MANIIPDLIICAIFVISCFLIHLFSNVFQLSIAALTDDKNDGTISQFITRESSYGWMLKLSINCLGYSCVVLPAFLIYKYTNKINYLERCDNSYVYSVIKLCIKGSTSNSNEKYENINKTSISSKAAISSEVCLLIYCFVGLMSFYLTWGLLQEKIMTQEYEDREGNSTKFTDSQFLVFVNRFLAFIISGFYLLLKNDVRHRSPLYKYSYASLSNILSAWFQYEALKFVSFPTQVLAKSCKIIPVMLMGKIISRNKYEHYEYVTAAMISMGMIFFMFGSSDNHGSASVTTMTGVFLLSMYMISDSFTSNWQNDLFKTYSMSSIQMMCGVSLFSTIFTASSLSVQGGLMEPLVFASQVCYVFWVDKKSLELSLFYINLK